MLKQILIVTLVLFARSASAVEIQRTSSAFGIEAIKVHLNAGLDNSGSGQGLTGQARYTSRDFLPTATSYFAENNTGFLIWSLIVSCLAGLAMRLSCWRLALMKFHPTRPIQFIRRYGVRQLKSISTAVPRASLSEEAI